MEPSFIDSQLPIAPLEEHTPSISASSTVPLSHKKVLDTLTVIAEYRSNKPNILSLIPGDNVYVLTKTESGWWDGIILAENGTLRGWFPNTYCKSISNMSQSNHNPRPINLSAVLRQNLGNVKSRKNSSVSFASSEQSYHSDSPPSAIISSHQPHHQPQAHTISSVVNPAIKTQHSSIVDPTSTIFNLKEIKLVNPQEVESIFNSIGSSNVPIWFPVATTDRTIVYYNPELNIYCKELPYTETPELDESSNIAILTRDTESLTFANLTLNDSQTLQQQNARKSSAKTTSSIIAGFDRKESATGSIKSKSSVPSSTTVHPWNSSLYSEPDLFYYDPTDIRTWSGLRDAFLMFLKLTTDALNKKSGALFSSYFNITSRLAVLIHLSARLAQHDLQKSGYQSRVQRRLKHIASSIAQVGINGDLYLNEPLSDGVAKRNADTTRTDAQSDAASGSNEDSNVYLDQFNFQIDSLRKNSVACVKVFIQISSNQNNEQNYLPQVYPRFLSGFFSGGSWSNPFVLDPKDPFSEKEVVKSLHHKRVCKTVLNKETSDKLESLKDKIKLELEEVLVIIREKPNNQSRNSEIMAKAHKLLNAFSKYIDLIESLDLSIFLYKQTGYSLSAEFDSTKIIYPVLTEFFESKQNIRDITVLLILGFQNLTLGDPTVFKSIKEDMLDTSDKSSNIEPEKTAKELEAELLKIDIEKDHGLSGDADQTSVETIIKSLNLLEISATLVLQLTSEKDSLMNYATRVMNDSFPFELYSSHREDSILTSDEYQLPASATNTDFVKEEEWYLQPAEYNLIFTTNDAIKGGTKEALIQRLTHHDLLDAKFNITFLLTFKSMMNTSTLIELLIQRFNMEAPENLVYEEYANWVENKSYPIKLRVVNIMKALLQKYWIVDYNEAKLADIWGPFIETLLLKNFPGSEQLSKLYQKKVVEGEADTEAFLQESVNYSNKSKKMKLLDIDPTELANQLTIRDSGLYSQIKMTECLDKSWSKKYGSLGGFEHLQKFISNSNDLTNFIASQIVSYNDSKKRVTLIKYAITVAEKCRQLNNFSSMTAIISALYSSPIHRLKKTWKTVPAPILAQLQKMNDLMNSSRNFNEYREHLRFISDRPCVPFLGVFLSDLTFTTNGNPDNLHGDPKLINFAKRSKTVDILREISKYQNLKYNIKKNDDVQDFIASHLKDVMNIDDQYGRSLIIEPRIKVSQQLQQSHHESKRLTSKQSLSKHFGSINQ